MCTPTQDVWQPAGCVSCELVCVCVSLVRVVIICLASTHTALVSSPSLTVLHLTTYIHRPRGKRSRASTTAAGRRAAPNHGGRAAAARNPRHNANRARPSTGKHTPRLGHSVPRARERGWLLAREESFRDPLQDHARIIPRPGGRRDCNQSSRAACRSLGRLGRRGGEQGTRL